MKQFVFTKHSRESMRKRGVSEDEVRIAISKAPWQPSKWGRFECTLEFEYNKEWNKKFYRTKQVVPVFMEEETRIVIITVYAFYF
ncbi:MAG: DUF4258 domain-containing protein [candidate division WOR-3 bacterium]|nr:DUF4258 domain-containing protein [candidate division WOR-3 bacterium]